MRDHPLRLLSLAMAMLLAGGPAAGQPASTGTLSVVIASPPKLRVDARETLEIRVRTVGEERLPLMLTPSMEGAAVEVVRGRLLRSDARDPDAQELVFLLPIAVRSEGTSVLRVEVSTYECETRCRAVHASASRVLRVSARD